MGNLQKHYELEPSIINPAARPKHTKCKTRLRILEFEGVNGQKYILPTWWFCEKCCEVIFMNVKQVAYP